MELSARIEPVAGRVRSDVAYTVVDAEFRKGQFVSHTIPGTPRHTLHAGFGVSPVESFWIDLNWELINDFYRINDMANRLPKADNYGVLNVILRYDVPDRLISRGYPAMSAYLKIDNITNEEYVTFQSSNGTNLNGAGEYPMPSTTFVGGVSVKF